MKLLLARLRSDERGQDLIEYALLASFLAFGAVAAMGLLGTAMNVTYNTWDNAGQQEELVVVPLEPAGAADPEP